MCRDIFLVFQFKHCTIISERFEYLLEPMSEFQFKHCTIISAKISRFPLLFLISIQALYDYKPFNHFSNLLVRYFNSSIVRL